MKLVVLRDRRGWGSHPDTYPMHPVTLRDKVPKIPGGTPRQDWFRKCPCRSDYKELVKYTVCTVR